MVSMVMSNEEFENLLSQYEHKFQKGDLVKGLVCGYDADGAVVEIGSKTTAFIPKNEISIENNNSIQEVLKKGETYEFLIVSEISNEDGKFLLSRKKVEQAYVLKELLELKEKDETILGVYSSKIRGGILVDINGLKGFVPTSQISISKNYSIGDKLELKILKLDSQLNDFVLSNKKALGENDAETKENLFAQIEIGQVLKGKVVRITNFGAFIDLGGIDGLLPLSQMSWKWVEHPSDILEIGDKIEVEVIDIDNEKQRISLSIKSLTPDPWIDASETIHENDVVEGIITRLKDFGAFVEIQNGIEALLPQEDLLNYQNEHSLILNIGDKIEAKVSKFNPTDKRISLTTDTKTPTTV